MKKINTLLIIVTCLGLLASIGHFSYVDDITAICAIFEEEVVSL